MADFNPIFEVNAGAILTKLHLAGQSQVPNGTVINTAIKNPDKKATPDKPGNVEFDLENKSGEYQLAIIRPLEYLIQIEPMKNKKFAKAKENLDKFMKDHEKDLPKKEEGKDSDKSEGNDKEKEAEEKNEKTSLTDKDAQKKTEVNDSIQMKSFLEYLTEADDKKDKDNKKLLEQLEKLQAPLLAEFDSYKLDGYKQVENKETKKPDYDASAKLFDECLQKENKKRLEQKEKLTNECKKAALGDLKKYFINFAGKDNQAKIKDADIVVKNATAEGHIEEPKDFQDNIKEYKIEVEDVDEQIKKNEEKHQEKVNEPFAHDVALVVGYKIDIE